MARGLLFRTWLVTLVASLLLIALVYFVGPFLWPALGDTVSVVIATVVILAIWAGYNGFRAWRARRRDRALIEGVAGGEDKSGAEVRLLRDRLEHCLKRIKETAGAEGARHLSELPWYILIGPPGSGKTTALAKSELRFIGLNGRNIEAVSGIGGTRNCDWFFSEQAVLLDTAGRFTTQDSDESADRATWLGFLDLLKNYRARQPINGAIVATSLPDLAVLTETARRQQAQIIRERLSELRNRLGVAFPVYVVFTKLDRVNGFIDFFTVFQKEERRQVWGFTLPTPDRKKDDRDDVVTEARAAGADLFARLADRMIDRLYDEPDARRRSRIHAFPYQMASLRPAVEEFIEEAFGHSRYDRPALLRGVYFTSGVQEGTPIDRVMGVLSRAFGLSGARPGVLGGSGRSFFIADLLEKVIFPEAGLVGIDPIVERRSKRIRLGVYIGAAAAITIMLALWSVSALTNLSLIRTAEGQIPDYLQTVNPLLGSQPASSDPLPILPALAKLRAFSGADSPPPPFTAGFGLYQGDNLRDAGQIAYHNGLNSLMLPRLIARLTELVAQSSADPGNRYQYLKALLMLAGRAPGMDNGFIETIFGDIWRNDGVSAENSDQLKLHLTALLDRGLPTIPLDPGMIEAVQADLARQNPAFRAYAAIKASREVRTLKDWILEEHIGTAGDEVLTVPAGQNLASVSIPGLFTHEGFQRALLAGAGRASETIASDPWVLDGKATRVPADQLTRSVTQLYEDEFIKVWDTLLRELSVKRIHDVDEAEHVLAVLSGPTSPLATLIPDIVKETQLNRKSEELAVAGIVAPGQAATIGKIESAASSLAAAAGEAYHPGAAVQAHYAKLAQYVGNGGGSSQLDVIMRELGDASVQLQRASGPGQDASLSAALANASSFRQLKNQADSGMPPPLATLVGSIGEQTSSVAVVGARDQVKGDWNGSVLPDCKAVIDGRYPFQRDDSGPGVTIEDFSNLFAANGKIDSYFNQNLKPLVDTTGPNWKWKSGAGANVGLNPDFLIQMQRAAKIRAAFFHGGTGSFGFTLFITPRQLDASVKSADLSINGQTVSYAFGPQQQTDIQWPGSSGLGQIRLALIPQTSGPTPTVTAAGPWAWYRFVDQGRVEAGTSANEIRLTFMIDGHSVTYDVAGGSVFTPLTAQNLVAFRCPSL